MSYTAFKSGKLVYIMRYWYGSVTGAGTTIATIQDGYRPKNVIFGGGMFYNETGGSFMPGMNCNSTGKISQTQTSGTVTRGEFTFIYSL